MTPAATFAYARPDWTGLIVQPKPHIDLTAGALMLEAALSFGYDSSAPDYFQGAASEWATFVRPAFVILDKKDRRPLSVIWGGETRAADRLCLDMLGFIIERDGVEHVYGATTADFSHPLDAAALAIAKANEAQVSHISAAIVGGFHEPIDFSLGVYRLRMKHLGSVFFDGSASS